MPKPLLIALFLGAWLLPGAFVPIAPAGAGPIVIKTAVVTPEGSTWVRVLKQMAVDVKTKTNEAVDFTIYAGGVSGDEADVLRKMQVNRIHAAGFSGVGLGLVLPEVRVLEAPLLFRNDAEIDAVRERIFDSLAEAFLMKGYVLLGFTEGGWVYLFSRRNLARDEEFRSAKMWVWKGDQVAETLLHNFGVRTTPLHIAEVNTGLETHMIDSFYSPPLAAIAFQWHARVQYLLDYPLADSTAGLLMTRRAFEALPAGHQAILKQSAREHCRELVALTRAENRDALAALKSQGLIFVQPSRDQLIGFEADAQKTYSQSIPGLYSQTLFDRIQAILKEVRAGASNT
jgi:TRAP-type C4-dicarboxylate transport system substrate-binding protein